MAATVEWYSYHGVCGGGCSLQISNIRYNLADDNDQDETNKCVRPAVGTNLSFWKVLALYATVAPGTGINNVYVFTDGALAWTDCTVYTGDETPAAYDQATGDSISGDAMVANYGGGGVITGQTDFYTYVTGEGNMKSWSGSIGAATGKITDYLVLQLSIGTSAVLGQQASETYTAQYDET